VFVNLKSFEIKAHRGDNGDPQLIQVVHHSMVLPFFFGRVAGNSLGGIGWFFFLGDDFAHVAIDLFGESGFSIGGTAAVEAFS
jgi:hypothetical protein